MSTVKQKKSVNYINNADFYAALIEYKRLKSENDTVLVPNYIGKCILMICERLSTKPNFIRYTFRDEMISDAIENCISSIKGFDPEKSNNPFAYFTQIAWNAFIRRITREQKQLYLKHKNAQLLSISDNYQLTNEIGDDIIQKFEDKNKLTKTKKKDTIKGIEIFAQGDVYCE